MYVLRKLLKTANTFKLLKRMCNEVTTTTVNSVNSVRLNEGNMLINFDMKRNQFFTS